MKSQSRNKSGRKQKVLSSRNTVIGRVRLLSVLVITVGFITYLLFLHVLPKDNILRTLSPEPESLAAGKVVTSTNPIIIEAENMSYLASPDGIQTLSDTTASGESGKLLTINSTIVSSVTIEEAVSKIIVTAKGENCHGWPNAVVAIGGVTVFDKKITSASWRDFSSNLSVQPGTYSITVTFNNDYSGQNCNRNLMIDKITLL